MTDIRPAVTIDELAAASGKHPKTVRVLIERGELPGYKTSMGYVIPRAWFEEWEMGGWTPRAQPDDGTPPTNVMAIHKRTARKAS